MTRDDCLDREIRERPYEEVTFDLSLSCEKLESREDDKQNTSEAGISMVCLGTERVRLAVVQ